MKNLSRILIIVLMTGMIFGQTYIINETFGTVPPSGWTNGTPAPTQGTSSQDGDAKSLLYVQNNTNAAIVTSSVTDPDRLSFYHLASNNAFTGTFNVNYGTSSSGPWTNLVSVTNPTTTWTQSATELSLPAGTYYFQLIRTDATRKDLFVDVFQVTKSIVPSTTSLSGFIYEPSNGPSAEQSFTVSGANLTNDIIISPPTNYEISTGTGGGFSATNPITLTQSGGTVNATTIYVRLKAGLSEGAYNSETITISSTGKINKTVTCSGDVKTSMTASTASLSNFNYDTGSGPSSEQSFTVFGQDLSANITITAPTNYEVSSTSGSGFSTSVTLIQSGGIVDTSNVYVRLKAGLSQGTYNNEDITISSTGKVSKTVTCSGFVGPCILNIKVFIEGALW